MMVKEPPGRVLAAPDEMLHKTLHVLLQQWTSNLQCLIAITNMMITKYYYKFYNKLTINQVQYAILTLYKY